MRCANTAGHVPLCVEYKSAIRDVERRTRLGSITSANPVVERVQRRSQDIGMRASVDWRRARQQSAVNRCRRSEHCLEQGGIAHTIAVVGIANTQVVGIGMRGAGNFPGANQVGVGLTSAN